MTPIETVQAFLRALEQLDFEGALEHCADGMVYQNVPLPPARGKAAVARTLRSFEHVMDRFEVRMHNIAANGPVVLTERTDVLAKGKYEIVIWVCGTFEVHDGKSRFGATTSTSQRSPQAQCLPFLAASCEAFRAHVASTKRRWRRRQRRRRETSRRTSGRSSRFVLPWVRRLRSRPPLRPRSRSDGFPATRRPQRLRGQSARPLEARQRRAPRPRAALCRGLRRELGPLRLAARPPLASPGSRARPSVSWRPPLPAPHSAKASIHGGRCCDSRSTPMVASTQTSPDRPPLQPWLAERWFDLAPMEWLELWTEVKARSYGVMTAWGDPITNALLAVSKAERHAWAKRWCDTILRSPDRQLQAFVGKTVALAYTLTGEAVPAPITKMLAMKPLSRQKWL